MRKLAALLLTVVLCLTLCACESAPVKDLEARINQVKEVDALIDAIGTVTVHSAPDIQAAEKAFAALSQEDMGWVQGYETLVAARQSYENLYTPVEITTENWNEYFELAVEEEWRTDMSDSATQLRNHRLFRLKPEYANKFNPKKTHLELRVNISAEARITTIDWEQKTFEEGTPIEALQSGSADFTWTEYHFDPDIPPQTEINIGYSHLSNPKSDRPESRIFVFTHEIAEISGTIAILQS